ncbi:vacuolar alkaline phosphatase, partial [Elasticomyces elasticus]
MARDDALLAPRVSSDLGSVQEDDGLLSGDRSRQQVKQQRKAFWREFGLFAWAVIATVAVVVLACVYQQQKSHQGSNKPTWGPGEKPTG